MSNYFEDVQKRLKSTADAPKNWQLFTITFDPEFDTPEILKGYSKRYNADPQHWNFLTGELIDITAIAEQFGLLFWRPDPKEVTNISHNLRTVVIDAQGKVQKILKDNEWTPEILATEIIEAAKKAG